MFISKLGWGNLLSALVLLLVILFSLREYHTRKYYSFDGVVKPCQYQEAKKNCFLFVTSNNLTFLLTDGSVEIFARKGVNLETVYFKKIQVKATISNQKIKVLGAGELRRLKIIDFEV